MRSNLESQPLSRNQIRNVCSMCLCASLLHSSLINFCLFTHFHFFWRGFHYWMNWRKRRSVKQFVNKYDAMTQYSKFCVRAIVVMHGLAHSIKFFAITKHKNSIKATEKKPPMDGKWYLMLKTRNVHVVLVYYYSFPLKLRWALWAWLALQPDLSTVVHTATETHTDGAWNSGAIQRAWFMIMTSNLMLVLFIPCTHTLTLTHTRSHPNSIVCSLFVWQASSCLVYKYKAPLPLKLVW